MSALLEQALSHHQRGDNARARRDVSAVLAKEPLNGDAWHLHGVIALQTGQYAEALEHLRRAAMLKPNDCAVNVNFAAALSAASHLSQAEHVLKHALTLDGRSPEAHYQMGACLLAMGRHEAARPFLAEAVNLRPAWPQALELLGNTLFRVGEHEAGVDCARRALAMEPNRAACHRIIADGCLRWMQYDQASEHYRKALAIAPQDPLIHNNYALLLTRLGRADEALAEYRKTLALVPDMRHAQEGLAFILLMRGQFKEGWPLYLSRLKAKGTTFALRDGPPPIEDPAQIRGKSVLAWVDQGIGDQIMFGSILPDLVAAGAHLTFECSSRLVPIFKRSFPEIAVRPMPTTIMVSDPLRLQTEPAPKIEGKEFDYQTYLPDAARFFRNDFDAFPRQRGYLKADEALRQKFRESYTDGAKDRPLIGIAWRTTEGTKISAQKTLGLATWQTILENRQATFVNLQYGDHREEIQAASDKFGTRILCDATVDSLTDMDTYAAQVSAMDLVITTSNAAAHMAGSLNVPAWVMAPAGFGMLWHWFQGRDDSPWYPSVRIFRQHTPGDWQQVLLAITAALDDFCARWQK